MESLLLQELQVRPVVLYCNEDQVKEALENELLQQVSLHLINNAVEKVDEEALRKLDSYSVKIDVGPSIDEEDEETE